MSKTRPVCSIAKFGKDQLVTQHLYKCLTCHFSSLEVCCESCAKFCHQKHELIDLGYGYGYCSCGRGCSKCHCFCENPVDGDLDIPEDTPRQCTFRESGTNFTPMEVCNCSRCGFTGSAVVCVPCSLMCHKNHNPVNRYHSSGAYCDCGDPSNHTFQCKLAPPESPPEPIPVCMNLLRPHNTPQHQCYKCQTCNIDKICEGCIKKCHQGHEIIPLDSMVFECQCRSYKCLILNEKEPAA